MDLCVEDYVAQVRVYLTGPANCFDFELVAQEASTYARAQG